MASTKESPRSSRGVMKRKRCGVCPGCLAQECGNCRYCLDMKKRGGSGTLRRPCEMRGCVATSSGEVRDSAPRRKKKRAILVESYLPVRCRKTVCVDGRTFGACELGALCDAVEEEEHLDWHAIAEKLEAREASFDALLTLRRAATRLEDEARAAEVRTSTSSRGHRRDGFTLGTATALHSLQSRQRRPTLAPPMPRSKRARAASLDGSRRARGDSYDDSYDGDCPAAANGDDSDLEDDDDDDDDDDDRKWSAARCRVLWGWVAYAKEPPASTISTTTTTAPPTIDENDEPSEFGDEDDVLDPWEFAYRARSGKTAAKKATFLAAAPAEDVRRNKPTEDQRRRDDQLSLGVPARSRGDSDASRLEDLTAAAMLYENDDAHSSDRRPNDDHQSNQSNDAAAAAAHGWQHSEKEEVPPPKRPELLNPTSSESPFLNPKSPARQIAPPRMLSQATQTQHAEGPPPRPTLPPLPPAMPRPAADHLASLAPTRILPRTSGPLSSRSASPYYAAAAPVAASLQLEPPPRPRPYYPPASQPQQQSYYAPPPVSQSLLHRASPQLQRRQILPSPSPIPSHHLPPSPDHVQFVRENHAFLRNRATNGGGRVAPLGVASSFGRDHLAI